MIKEIQAASAWWGHQLSKSVNDASSVASFTSALAEILTAHCRGHWYEDDSERGSAYRALTFDVRLDPLLCQAAAAAGLSNPVKLFASAAHSVMYINPGSVRVRSIHNHYVPAHCIFPALSEVAFSSPQHSAAPSPSSIASPIFDAPNTPTSPDFSRPGSPSSSPSPLGYPSHSRAASDVVLPQSMYASVAAAALAVVDDNNTTGSGSGSNSPSSTSPRLPSHPGAPVATYSLQQYHPVTQTQTSSQPLPQMPRPSPPNSGRRPSRNNNNNHNNYTYNQSRGQQQQQQQRRFPQPQALRQGDVEAHASIPSFAMPTSSPSSSSPTATPQSGPAPSEYNTTHTFSSVPVRAQVSVV